MKSRLAAVLILAFGSTAFAYDYDDCVAGLRSGDVDETLRGLLALPRYGERAREMIPEVEELLNKADRNILKGAIETLGKLGAKRSAKPIRPYLAYPVIDIRLAAAHALAQIGECESLAVIVAKHSLSSKWATYRAEGAEVLGLVGFPLAAAVAKDLGALLADEDESVRRAAMQALVATGRGMDDALPALLAVLKDGEDAAFVVDAITVIGLIGEGATKAMRPLRKVFLDDERPIEVRVAALRAMPRFGAKASQASSDVIRCLKREGAPDELRTAALEALDATPVRAGKAVPILREILAGDGSPELRADAARVVGKLGKRAVEAHPELEAALKDDDPTVRLGAALGLGRLPDPPAEIVALLVDGTSGSFDVIERVASCEVLGVLGSRASSARAVLAKLAADESESEELRSAARAALEAIPGE